MRKILSAVLAAIMLLSVLTISAGAVSENSDDWSFSDPGPDNPDYIHDLTVSLPVTNTWADSAWVCEFNGTGEDVYIYAVSGSKSASYNLGYSVGGSNNLAGWYPNLKTGLDGIVIHTKITEFYEIRASVPEGTGGEFNIVISRKPLDLTWSEDLPFTDIPRVEDCTNMQDNSLRQAVLYVYANGLMTGTSATTFSPNESLTRAMLWTVLARMNGVSVELGDPWYAPARKWAMDAGISDGSAPEQALSLQEAVTMLHRQAGKPAATYPVNVDQDGKTADWARDAMAWALSTGLINGGKPSNAVTRAELANMLLVYGWMMKG